MSETLILFFCNSNVKDTLDEIARLLFAHRVNKFTQKRQIIVKQSPLVSAGVNDNRETGTMFADWHWLDSTGWVFLFFFFFFQRVAKYFPEDAQKCSRGNCTAAHHFRERVPINVWRCHFISSVSYRHRNKTKKKEENKNCFTGDDNKRNLTSQGRYVRAFKLTAREGIKMIIKIKSKSKSGFPMTNDENGWIVSVDTNHRSNFICSELNVLFSLPCTALHGRNVSAAHCGTRRRIPNPEPGCPSFL